MEEWLSDHSPPRAKEDRPEVTEFVRQCKILAHYLDRSKLTPDQQNWIVSFACKLIERLEGEPVKNITKKGRKHEDREISKNP